MSTAQRRLPKEEIARRGDEIYESRIRPGLTPDDHGKYVAIDVESGDFVVDSNEMAAIQRLRERNSDAQAWMLRIGSRALRRFGTRHHSRRP